MHTIYEIFPASLDQNKVQGMVLNPDIPILVTV